jgi:hypothetical protein
LNKKTTCKLLLTLTLFVALMGCDSVTSAPTRSAEQKAESAIKEATGVDSAVSINDTGATVSADGVDVALDTGREDLKPSVFIPLLPDASIVSDIGGGGERTIVFQGEVPLAPLTQSLTAKLLENGYVKGSSFLHEDLYSGRFKEKKSGMTVYVYGFEVGDIGTKLTLIYQVTPRTDPTATPHE